MTRDRSMPRASFLAGPRALLTGALVCLALSTTGCEARLARMELRGLVNVDRPILAEHAAARLCGMGARGQSIALEEVARVKSGEKAGLLREGVLLALTCPGQKAAPAGEALRVLRTIVKDEPDEPRRTRLRDALQDARDANPALAKALDAASP